MFHQIYFSGINSCVILMLYSFTNNCTWFANIFLLLNLIGSILIRKLELYFLTAWFLYYVFCVCFNWAHNITLILLLQDNHTCSLLCLHSTLNSPFLLVSPPPQEIKEVRMLSNCSFSGCQWCFLNIKGLFIFLDI